MRIRKIIKAYDRRRERIHKDYDKPKKEISWQSYWTHQSEVLFLGFYSEIVDGKMPNKVIGATDFLTVAGAAGSETYQVPNTAAYIAADTDYIWFKTNEDQRTASTAEIIGYDFTRTIVKYANTAPYAIETIMILKSDVDTTKMRDDFELSIWWSNVLSAHGNVKENRGVGKSIWDPSLFAPSGLTLSLISGGVKIDWVDENNGNTSTEIWGQSDGSVYDLLYTINAGIITKNDENVPAVDLRYYKIRAKLDSMYSDFTEEESIAMLGVEMRWQNALEDITTWNVHNVNWSSDGVKLISNGNNGSNVRWTFWTIGKKYRTVCTVTVSGGGVHLPYASAYNHFVEASGTYTDYYNVTVSANMKFYSVGFNGSIDSFSIKEVLFP